MSNYDNFQIPSVLRRVKFELARKGMSETELKHEIRKVTGIPYSQARVSAMIHSTNPQTKTLYILARALRIRVNRFFDPNL